MQSVGKYGVIERAYYDGRPCRLFCLSKATEIDNLILFLDLII